MSCDYQNQELYTPVAQLSDEIRDVDLDVTLNQRYSGTLPAYANVAAPEGGAPELTPPAPQPASRQWLVKTQENLQNAHKPGVEGRSFLYGDLAVEHKPTGAVLKIGVDDTELGYVEAKTPRFWGNSQIRVLRNPEKTELGLTTSFEF
jgi:hypothetical protein